MTVYILLEMNMVDLGFKFEVVGVFESLEKAENLKNDLILSELANRWTIVACEVE